VVVSYHDTPSALRILNLVKDHAPQVPVIVRTIDDTDLEVLQAAGATEVVPEAIEGSLMLASHALALVGIPMRRVLRIVQDQRDARYGLLRGYFHGADDDTADELQTARLHSITLPAGAACSGQTLGQLSLHAVGVSVASLRLGSNGSVIATPDDGVVLSSGDTLVLSGLPEALSLAEEKLMG
jgi:CPA2 family monovalent cation:H+ antiporter-2